MRGGSAMAQLRTHIDTMIRRFIILLGLGDSGNTIT